MRTARRDIPPGGRGGGGWLLPLDPAALVAARPFLELPALEPLVRRYLVRCRLSRQHRAASCETRAGASDRHGE